MKRPLALLVVLLAAACAAPTSRELPRAEPAAEGFDPARLAAVTDVVRGPIERGECAGATVLVMRDGNVVLEESVGLADLAEGEPMRPDTIVRIYSMTKMVTSVAALQLIEDGRIGLDDPVTRWLPELEGLRVLAGGTADAPELVPLARPLTVRMLINHTAGMTYDFFGDSPVVELYRRADLWSAPTLDEFVARAARLPLLRQPGEGFDYGIANDLLGALVQRASGQSFEDFVAERITEPLGMRDTGFDVPEEQRARVAALHQRVDGELRVAPVFLGVHEEPGEGFASGGAGLFSTIEDYARLVQCLLEGGELDGARILERETVELAMRSSLPGDMRLWDPTQVWGLLAAVQVEPPADQPGNPGLFTWGGAATTLFFADPAEDLVALVFAQHLPFDEPQLFASFRRAVYDALETRRAD